jgi:hypothetical protein
VFYCKKGKCREILRKCRGRAGVTLVKSSKISRACTELSLLWEQGGYPELAGK